MTTPPQETNPRMTRRSLLIGSAVVAGGVVLGGAASWPFLPGRIKGLVLPDPDPYIPDAEEGKIELESVFSQERGIDVDLFTAVPAGYGDGKGLPVVVVLHGATGTPSLYQEFGLGRFLTATVEAGAEPFVLAGAAGGVLRWEPQPSGDNPQAMVLNEMPEWLQDRGFDADRRAVWGWSMGGYGALRLAEVDPGWGRATAAFSPAVAPGDAVFADMAQLEGQPLGLWCGTDDGFYDAVHELATTLPEEPEIASFSEGGHTRVYWNEQTVQALTFLASHLSGGS
ncbi:MAG: alpha/beta hydrolase-fold protein [Candidatus Nanopelagicales bacterium]